MGTKRCCSWMDEMRFCRKEKNEAKLVKISSLVAHAHRKCHIALALAFVLV
jgi:hypothetical protein